MIPRAYAAATGIRGVDVPLPLVPLAVGGPLRGKVTYGSNIEQHATSLAPPPPPGGRFAAVASLIQVELDSLKLNGSLPVAPLAAC